MQYYSIPRLRSSCDFVRRGVFGALAEPRAKELWSVPVSGLAVRNQGPGGKHQGADRAEGRQTGREHHGAAFCPLQGWRSRLDRGADEGSGRRGRVAARRSAGIRNGSGHALRAVLHLTPKERSLRFFFFRDDSPNVRVQEFSALLTHSASILRSLITGHPGGAMRPPSYSTP